MGERDPLVSVIIPTFNREAYLREAVGSVFAQTYAHWELIVADDGSTDGTRAYLASLRDQRVRVVALEHTGTPARVRNAALAQATGRYVAFLDDDDLWMPQKLARQVADLQAKPTCHWSYTHFIRIGQSGEEIGPWPSRSNEGWILGSLVSGQRMATPSVLAEQSLIADIGGFDECLVSSEDFDAFIRMAMASEVACLPTALCAVRDHPNNTWKELSLEEIILNQVRVYEKVLAHPLSPSVRAACVCQRASWEIQRAHWLRTQHAYGKSLRAFVRALYRGRNLPAWWMVKASLRPVMPPAAMRLYRALRNA